MLFELDNLPVFVGFGLGFVLGVVAHALAQALMADATGDRRPRLARRRTPDLRRHVDAFGLVAMLVAGLGWGRPVELTESRRGRARTRYLLVLLAGPLAHLGIGLIFLAAAHAAGFSATTASGAWAPTALAAAGVLNVWLAVLQLVPLPPLDGARMMWVLAPSTLGWQRARYYLEEQNYGVGAVLLLLLPIFGGRGMLYRLVVAVAQPVVDSAFRILGVA
ncbi:MAG: hypothetical protein ABR520_00190 [Mycobacteriales bacterium]|nr:hypothetical protein [Frankia sp.]